jgi:hypothetical protein
VLPKVSVPPWRSAKVRVSVPLRSASAAERQVVDLRRAERLRPRRVITEAEPRASQGAMAQGPDVKSQGFARKRPGACAILVGRRSVEKERVTPRHILVTGGRGFNGRRFAPRKIAMRWECNGAVEQRSGGTKIERCLESRAAGGCSRRLRGRSVPQQAPPVPANVRPGVSSHFEHNRCHFDIFAVSAVGRHSGRRW